MRCGGGHRRRLRCARRASCPVPPPAARPPLLSTAPRADRRAAAVRAVVGVNDLLLLLSAYGSTTAVADSGCAITAAHRSILSSVESLFPCEDCITACFDQGGVGAEGPDWDEPTATCEFMDAIYTTETHNDCLNSCSHETLVQGFELFLACHGGVAVVGDSFDTPTTLALRATLLNTVDGNCWGQTWSVSCPSLDVNPGGAKADGLRAWRAGGPHVRQRPVRHRRIRCALPPTLLRTNLP